MIRTTRKIILAAVLLLFVPSSFAGTKVKGVAFDLELYGAFVNFVRLYIDKDKVERLPLWGNYRRKHVAVVSKNYLSQPGAFHALPQDVKDTLTQGLSLEDVNIMVPKMDLDVSQTQKNKGTPSTKTKSGLYQPGKKDDSVTQTRSGLYHPAQKPVGDKKKLTTTSQTVKDKLKQHEAETGKKFEKSRGGLYLPQGSVQRSRAQTAWETVLKRWDALPEITKILSVKFRHLSDTMQAKIILEIFAPNSTLRIVNSVPLLRNVILTLDGRTPELKHESSFKSIARLKSFFETFSSTIGISTEIFKPRSDKHQSAGIHYHISFKNYPWDTIHADDVMRLYKFHNALELYGMGETKVFQNPAASTKNTYLVPFDAKGNIRKIGELYYEIREPLQGPGETLTEVRQLLSMKPENARKRLLKKVEQALSTISIQEFSDHAFSGNPVDHLDLPYFLITIADAPLEHYPKLKQLVFALYDKDPDYSKFPVNALKNKSRLTPADIILHMLKLSETRLALGTFYSLFSKADSIDMFFRNDKLVNELLAQYQSPHEEMNLKIREYFETMITGSSILSMTRITLQTFSTILEMQMNERNDPDSILEKFLKRVTQVLESFLNTFNRGQIQEAKEKLALLAMGKALNGNPEFLDIKAAAITYVNSGNNQFKNILEGFLLRQGGTPFHVLFRQLENRELQVDHLSGINTGNRILFYNGTKWVLADPASTQGIHLHSMLDIYTRSQGCKGTVAHILKRMLNP